MIAPARIAAYEILRAVSSGRADLPTAIASARDSLRDDRDRALAAEIATGVQRWRAALDHLIAALSKRAVRSSGFGGRRHPPAERIPAAASHPCPGFGGRRRCRETDAACGETKRRGFRERRSADAVAPPERSAAARATSVPPGHLRPRGGDGGARRATGLSLHHAVPPAVAGGAMARAIGLRDHRSVAAFQQHACAADAASEPASGHAGRSHRPPRPRRRPPVPRTLRAGRVDRRLRSSPS
jgi:hypothetical protein